jgi:hypothetical protein
MVDINYRPDPDKFHKHLDECKQCRDNPFDLCPVGHVILTGELTEGKNEMGEQNRDMQSNHSTVEYIQE